MFNIDMKMNTYKIQLVRRSTRDGRGEDAPTVDIIKKYKLFYNKLIGNG